MVAQIGAAHATLTLSPDPPATGRVHGIVTVDGAAPAALASTDVRFGSSMPAMSMAGPSGVARRTGPGRWEFDASFGMATAWALTLRFSGGLDGTAVYRFAVSGADGGNAAMAGMSSSAGNPDAWKYAAIALVAILVLAMLVVVVRRNRRPLTIGIVLGSALVVVVLAIVQARYASPPMDMTAMSSVQGSGATPVTLASVRTTQSDARIRAPGTIAPFFTQEVVTRAAGVLRGFNVYAGDRVAAGQVIALLDAPDVHSRAAASAAEAQAQAATARASAIEAHHHAPNAVVIAEADAGALQRDIAAAQADVVAKAAHVRYWQNEIRREKSLLDQGAVSMQEYQDESAQQAAAQGAYAVAGNKVGALQQQLTASRTKAMDAVASVSQMQAQADAAQALARRAQANASTDATLAAFTTITSPGDAVVVKRLVDPGVYVQTGTAIARLAVVNRLRVQANVAQRDLAHVAVGAPVDATLQDGTVMHGRVSSIAPVADPATHTASVEAIVNNARAGLVPGGFVQVVIHGRPS
ncbi:MAG: efflux RND transporter periplasmic adaptor subunit, partial [Candidatus Eremiobacteraeota bacterium]|nr:efflux RND transporter periplasmic adaptor subunit [Candidatus Eremiobacteraeota bacterium]